MDRPPRVSVNLPCYHQLAHAQRCVESIRAQTLEDIEITLLDDGASDDYREWVAALGDPRVRYQRNPARLGAMGNMFAAITAGRGDYTLAFHEDDLLGMHYLEIAAGILDRDPACGFVGAEVRQFEREPAAADLAYAPTSPIVDRYPSAEAFVRAVLSGVNPMFGSILYRRAAVAGIAADHDRFATLVDRPFLMTILERWSAAMVREPLVWYRAHGEGDARHLAMAPEHILRLLSCYRAALPRELAGDDRALFYDFSGYWLFTLFRLVPPEAQGSLRRFVLRAWREGLYNPRWSRGYGRKRLIGLLLTGR